MLYDKSHAYSVFDTRKFSILITTGLGVGVAVEKASSRRTYMKMATGGVNVGLGGQFFQLVLLFENKTAFQKFVNQGYEAAGAGAGAVAGKESEDLAVCFHNGAALFQLTEKRPAAGGGSHWDQISELFNVLDIVSVHKSTRTWTGFYVWTERSGRSPWSKSA